ncbi:hypothetical protein LWI28_018464 [Acer negundo]|uniref:FAD linked oxidase N-terminal domain-containing protein n=1 Tax=Acer negundo TaxID=4023 RepID=A0AAD5JAT9_ACENE|nr:hypothetical protein LWI28_018464 [Acer negundo]
MSIKLPPELKDKIQIDPDAIKAASTDYGHIVTQTPAGVLFPSSVEDLKTLIGFSFNSSVPYTIAAKGWGHSVHGEAMATNGVVVEMPSLVKNGSRIVIGGDKASGFYTDVGGEQLWIDVLNATVQKGLTPVSWTDYLYLTVGGTLSNAGISGQTHLRGPQINNVYELDVVTGTGFLLLSSSIAFNAEPDQQLSSPSNEVEREDVNVRVSSVERNSGGSISHGFRGRGRRKAAISSTHALQTMRSSKNVADVGDPGMAKTCGSE